jgi:hypothetical protein
MAALQVTDQSRSRPARSAARNVNDVSWSEPAPWLARETDIAIATQLERDEFPPCLGGRFKAEIISKHHTQHQLRSDLGRICLGERPPKHTIVEMAQQTSLDPG